MFRKWSLSALALSCVFTPAVLRAQTPSSLGSRRAESTPAAGALRRRQHGPVDDEAGASVSLPQLLAHAAQHALPLRLAEARLGLARAERRAAAPLLTADPELSLSIGPRIGARGEALDVEVALQQRIQVAGERGLRRKTARRFGERLQAALRHSRWRAGRAVHAAFRFAQVQRDRLQVAARLFDFSQLLLGIAKRRELAGAISGLEVQLVLSDVARAHQARLAARIAYRDACFRLAEKAGWRARRPPEPTGALELPRPVPPDEALLQRAWRHHTWVALAWAKVREAQAQAALAERERFPKPSLGLAYAREGAANQSATHVVLGTLSMPVPLWQRNQGQQARAHAQVALAHAELAAIKRRLRNQIVRAAAAVKANAARIGAYRAMVAPMFGRSLQMLQRAFEAGKIDVMQVMVSRTQQLEIQAQALDAYEAYYRALAALEAAVGSELWQGAEKGRAQ